MNKNEWKKWVSVAGRLLLALLLVFSQSALAGQDPKAKEKPDLLQKAAAQQTGEKLSSAAAPGESRATGRGSHEGIKVHGHWTIEVRNSDGTVVTHREFENSLGPSGANSLAAVLSRGGSVGFWMIDLQDALGTANQIGPCIITQLNNKGSDCQIFEPGWFSGGGVPASYQFPTLTVSSAGSNPAQLVLSGTAVASVSDAIATVITALNVCPATIAPSSPCSTTSGLVFTTHTFTNNFVNVTAGQTIAVTVTISFS